MIVDSQFFTVKQAAELLNTREQHVLNAIHSGELVAVNVAKNPQGKRPSWRIPESSLSKFLIGRRHPASVRKPEPPAKKRRVVHRYV